MDRSVTEGEEEGGAIEVEGIGTDWIREREACKTDDERFGNEQVLKKMK